VVRTPFHTATGFLGDSGQVRSLAKVMDGAAPTPIVVDMTDLRFLASAGLGFLAQLRNHVAPAGHSVTLHEPDRSIRRTIALLGFDQVFDITPPAL
jgi:anti-anti-sigma factor